MVEWGAELVRPPLYGRVAGKPGLERRSAGDGWLEAGLHSTPARVHIRRVGTDFRS